MAMQFWEAQREAKSKTFYFVSIFFVFTCIVAALAEVAMRTFAWDSYGNPPIPYVGFGFLGVTFLVAGFNYMNYLEGGGSYVAESMGGIRVFPNTPDPRGKMLLNVVEEISLATQLPIPPVYVIEADEINAFAAGTSPENAAIAVTLGSLDKLSRDELQGVLAHEFGHIAHRDMKIGMRIAAMVMGFFIITYIGLRLLGTGGYSRRSDNRQGGNPIVVLALILLVAGSVTWFFGSILQAMVSRQREFLADASSVQYTRNPAGLAGALRKIAKKPMSDMPKDGQPFAHLYFNEHPSFWSRLFATHPPIEERLAAIEGRKTESIP